MSKAAALDSRPNGNASLTTVRASTRGIYPGGSAMGRQREVADASSQLLRKLLINFR